MSSANEIGAQPERPASPCVRVCMLEETRRRCVGCHRTIDEIVAWRQMTAAEQWAVVSQLPERAAQATSVTGGRWQG